MTPPLAARPAVDLPGLAARTEALLRAHVPLTLLLDLASSEGPRSRELYAAEPGDVSWLAAG